MIRKRFAILIIAISILPLFSCGPTSSQIEINGVSFSFEESDLSVNDYLMLRHRHFSDLSELGDLFLRGTFPEIVSIYRNQRSSVTMEKVTSFESKQGKIHLDDPNLNETGRFYYCVSYSSNSKNYYAGFCYGGKESDEDTLKPLLELDVSQITIKKNNSTSSGYNSEAFTSRAESLKDDLIYCFKIPFWLSQRLNIIDMPPVQLVITLLSMIHHPSHFMSLVFFLSKAKAASF